MNKIKNRLLIAFGVSIGVLLLVMALDLHYSNKSVSIYEILNTRIDPAVKILEDFQSHNKELFLLSLNKLAAEQDDRMGNRMKIITEVELPYLNREAANLYATFGKDDSKIKSFSEIIEQSDDFMVTARDIFKVLSTSKDYANPETMQMATDLVYDELAIKSKDLEISITELQITFAQEKEAYQLELADRLGNLSLIILVTSITAILISLVVANKTIKSIVQPIKKLQDGAKRISKGEYEHRVSLEGKDELSMLGNNFNIMAKSLGRSFDNIKRKNKELEQFVYIASHDLQEPLRTVNSFTVLISEDYHDKLEEKGQNYLRFIVQASSRMQTLVKDLMDYSRLGTDKNFQVVDCKSLALNVQNDLAKLLEETGCNLIIRDLPEVRGYSTQLRLLFQNLINNAMKFHKPEVKPVIEIFSKDNGDFWKFGVRDNGIGIEEQYKEKIFSIFKRLHTRNEYEGTGIGLAHCQKIVEMHNGRIWVESELDTGSTFYFTLSKKPLKLF